MFKVRLIGRFDVQCDGKPVPMPSRSAQSLFAYLILTAGTSHRREKLAGMFWPDVTEEKARAYLRHELWRIRKALTAKIKVDYLSSDDISISFDPSAEYWLDVNAFTNVNENASIDELMNGLSGFQGELLPGFYDDWVTEEREHLQAIYEQKLMRLLELLQSEKRWNDILEWAERWISLGKDPEAAFRYLMIAYDALGDRAKVLSTYQRCVQALRRLELEPSEQTRALLVKRSSRINLPIPLTSFIGREKELKEVATLLSESRLVTLTGSGGVGKTRLAIQAVAEILDRFPDGVWFLDLAPLSDPALVPTALADLVGLRESQESPVNDLLASYFHSRAALVIFDNCEHLIESCAQFVNTFLTSCKNLSILATSREVLRVSGEVPYRVPSLNLPGADVVSAIDTLAATESGRLFIDRARVTLPGFALTLQNALAIAQICQRLDGIPLAIELAAARVNMLTVEQILKRLDDSFELLSHGFRNALPRHQTLRAAIEWSYDLLSPEEQTLLRRLSVFAGGWTLGAAEAVGMESSVWKLLWQLIDKSLVAVDHEHHNEARYHFLETIRQFAREKLLEAAEVDQVRARHLGYFLKLAKRAEPQLYGAGQIEWMQILENEHENIRTALEWSFQCNLVAGQQLATALWWSWILSGYLREGYDWLEKFLSVNSEEKTLIRANLLAGQGELAHALGYYELAKQYSEESIAMYRRLGDETGTAFPLSTLGMLSFAPADHERITQLVRASLELFKHRGNKWGVGRALRILAYNASLHGDFEQAQKFLEDCLLICEEIGDQEGLGFTLYLLAGCIDAQGHEERAGELYVEALEVERVVKSKPITVEILTELGYKASSKGDYRRGRQFLEEALEINQKMGNRGGVARSLRYLGWTARLQGDFYKARSLYYESLQLSDRQKSKNSIAASLLHVGSLFLVQGDSEKFVRILGCVEKTVPGSRNSLFSSFVNEIENFIEASFRSLGEEAYIVAWEAGTQMSLDEGIAYVLRELR